MSIPLTLTGKDFETQMLDALNKIPGVHAGRYGVKSALVLDGDATKATGKRQVKTIAIPSLPDVEGAFAPLGQQFIMELKVTTHASFGMNPATIKVSQVQHLLARSRVGVKTWCVIHWCEMKSKASGMTSHAAMTTALLVNDSHPRWRQFVAANLVAKKLSRGGKKVSAQPQPSITREEALREGVRIGWIIPPGCRNAVPDLAGLLGVRVEKPAQGDLF